jgi:hypothetical protein
MSVLTEEFSGFLVDEMKPGAGEADDGHIRIGLVLRRGLRKPMLYVRAQPWAFEKDMPAHRREYAKPGGRVTSVCLRSWGCPAEVSTWSKGSDCRRFVGGTSDNPLICSASFETKEAAS